MDLSKKTENRLFAAWFAIVVVVALAGAGLIGWALVELVLWVTSK